MFGTLYTGLSKKRKYDTIQEEEANLILQSQTVFIVYIIVDRVFQAICTIRKKKIFNHGVAI